VIDFLWKAIGYSLTGDVREDCLFLLYGTGANGKSTLLTILRAILADYGKQAAFSTFLHKENDPVRNDIADLHGARLVVASETDEGKRFSLSVVKQLTGQDKVKARFLFAENFEFAPQLKLWLAANHKPVIKGIDPAIWRRIRLIPFTQKFEGATKDATMRDKLLAELPGILAWAVRGCLAWQKDGLPMPDTVKNATADYKAESDTIGSFLEDCCLLNPQAKVKSSSLFNSYVAFSGDKLMTQTAFSRDLLERGYEKEKVGTMYWKGIGLIYDSTEGER
jgi:putative DNA primase/helicase